MGIFISMEGEETGHICISVEGVVVPVNIESVARACALMLGVICPELGLPQGTDVLL